MKGNTEAWSHGRVQTQAENTGLPTVQTSEGPHAWLVLTHVRLWLRVI